jgi:hypothetical protein
MPSDSLPTGPLIFEIVETFPDGWSQFGVAFSPEVPYLLWDCGQE